LKEQNLKSPLFKFVARPNFANPITSNQFLQSNPGQIQVRQDHRCRQLLASWKFPRPVWQQRPEATIRDEDNIQKHIPKVPRSFVDSQFVDSQLVDSQHIDSQLVDSQLIDSQLIDSQLIDSQLIDSQLIDRRFVDKN
jgi:hypothetical protein